MATLMTSGEPRTSGPVSRERWIPLPEMGPDYLSGARAGRKGATEHLWAVKNEGARYYFSFNSQGVAWLSL